MLEFTFSEMLWKPMTGFTVKPGKTARAGARLLIPPAEVERVMREVGPLPGPTGLRKLAAIKSIVEGWCACGRAGPRMLPRARGAPGARALRQASWGGQQRGLSCICT